MSYQNAVSSMLSNVSCLFNSLCDLLLEPIERISCYISQLNALKLYTPAHHPDRDDVVSSLQKIKEVERIIRQVCPLQVSWTKTLIWSDLIFIVWSYPLFRQGHSYREIRNFWVSSSKLKAVLNLKKLTEFICVNRYFTSWFHSMMITHWEVILRLAGKIILMHLY